MQDTIALRQQTILIASNAWLVAAHAGDVERLKQVESEILAEASEHVPWLRGIMLSGDMPADTREFAAGVLARIGTPEAVSALFVAYREQSRTNGESVNFLRAFDFVTNSVAARTLARCAVEASEPRAYAILVNASARCANQEQVQEFFSIFANPTTERDLFVAESILRKVLASELAPYLQQAIVSITNRVVLTFAASKLGDDGSASSIEALRQAALSAEGNQKTALLDGLFRVRSQEALPVLEKLALADQDRAIRKYAIYAFSNYPPEIAYPILDRLLQNDRAADMRKEVEFVRRFILKRKEYEPRLERHDGP